MSYTEITFFGKDGLVAHEDEIKNSWRGAMAVWCYMEEKYLPEYIPDWIKKHPHLHKEGKKYHRINGATDQEQKEIWNIVNLDSIDRKHQIVMMSTYDKVVVKKENFVELIESFRAMEFESSLNEQADIIEKTLDDDNIIAVGWNQTSVCSSDWDCDPNGEEDDEGEYPPYNLHEHKGHWFLFDEKLKDK